LFSVSRDYHLGRLAENPMVFVVAEVGGKLAVETLCDHGAFQVAVRLLTLLTGE
jgi:hypothetical protein